MISSTRRSRVLMLTSTFVDCGVIVGIALGLGPAEQVRLTPDAEQALTVAALPIRVELAQRIGGPSGTPRLLGKPASLAEAVPEPAPNAALRESLPRSPSYRAVGRGDSAVHDLGHIVKATGRTGIMPRRDPAAPRDKSTAALCPSSESVASSPACSAIDLFSSRGYLLLPRTHVRLGVASHRVNVVVHLATF